MVRERDQHRVDAALLSAPTRVARWLVRRIGADSGWRSAPAGQAGGSLVALPGGQARLGAELGLSRVTVNRALQSLRTRGFIEIHAGGVRVLDRDGLTRRAGL